MKENQVCIVNDPKTHTTKFVYAKDLIIDTKTNLTLGEYLESQDKKIESLEAENKKLKQAINDTVGVAALLNSK